MKRKLPTKTELITTLQNMLRREEQEHARTKHRLFLANETLQHYRTTYGPHKLSVKQPNQTKQTHA